MSQNISKYHTCPIVSQDLFEILLFGSQNILNSLSTNLKNKIFVKLQNTL